MWSDLDEKTNLYRIYWIVHAHLVHHCNSIVPKITVVLLLAFKPIKIETDNAQWESNDVEKRGKKKPLVYF